MYGSLLDACKSVDENTNENDGAEGKELPEEATLLDVDLTDAKPIRVVLIGVGNPLHTLLD